MTVIYMAGSREGFEKIWNQQLKRKDEGQNGEKYVIYIKKGLISIIDNI